ncbi:ABC transporter permease [Ochrobactrum sp. CM-21-5]|nr:ABC transporter permease [Ochrobactrum sp. CM-21-5]MBC2887645.1 ABC transporter permease [Ochrobactrum sp. CM-21-5]
MASPVIAPVPSNNERAAHFRLQLIYGALLAPMLLFLAALFCYPLIDMMLRGFQDETGFTLAHYDRIWSNTAYLRIIWDTVVLCFQVTLITLVLAYPVAYLLSVASPGLKAVMMALILIPFFTSILVRTYAWMVILGSTGLLVQLMTWFGLPAVSLLYNRTGVLIGMSYALLPYMILTLYSVMRGIDGRLMQAAANLGANGWQTFRYVFLPLSLPGITGGGLLVFIMALGYFITPRLLGGDRDQTISMIIDYQVEHAFNLNFAAALAGVLLILTLVGFLVYDRLVGFRGLLESKTL